MIASLDYKGRCCGRKPLHYKGGSWCSPPGSPMFFCTRCKREFDADTGEQRQNWAWVKVDGTLVPRKPDDRNT